MKLYLNGCFSVSFLVIAFNVLNKIFIQVQKAQKSYVYFLKAAAPLAIRRHGNVCTTIWMNLKSIMKSDSSSIQKAAVIFWKRESLRDKKQLCGCQG